MGNEGSQPLASSSKRLENNIKITWRRLERCPFEPREGQSCASIGSNLYIFGGVICGAATSDETEQQSTVYQETNQLIVINTERNMWEEVEVSDEIPEPRSGSTLSAVGDILYMFGGLSEDRGWLNDMHIFDTGSKTWSKLVHMKGDPPSPRDKLSSGVIGSDIYFFGGFGPVPASSDELQDIVEDDEDEEYEDEDIQEIEQEQQAAKFTWFNDVYKFDTVLQQWQWLKGGNNNSNPSPRAAHSMCTMDHSLIVFGGRDSIGRQNDVWSFSSATQQWAELATLGYKPEPRSFHAAVPVSGRMVVLGGRGVDNKHFQDFHVYDMDTNQWLQPDFEGNVIPPSMGLHSLSLVNKDIVLCFGTSNLDPVTNSCTTYHQDCFALTSENVLTGGVPENTERRETLNNHQNSLPAFLNLQPASSVNSSNGV